MLLDNVASEENLRKAWKKIKHRPDSYGSDGIKIKDFEQHLSNNISAISTKLQADSYEFELLRGVPILRTGRDPRPIRIPAVKDRVAQKSIQLEITPYLVKKYSLDRGTNFAYLEETGVYDAAMKIKGLYDSGHHWVFQGDIKSFFENINRDLLMKLVADALPDKSLSNLVAGAIKNEVSNYSDLERRHCGHLFLGSEAGVAQGGVLSPLLANVYLAEFDAALESTGFHLVRYADDFLIMGKNQKEVEDGSALADQTIKKLKLELHPTATTPTASKSSYLGRFQNIEFLGLRFQGPRVYPGRSAYSRMHTFLAELPKENETLANKLSTLSNRIEAWAASYWFTDVTAGSYKLLNTGLKQTVMDIMRFHGFKYYFKRFDKRSMKRIGCPTFDDALAIAKPKMEKRREEKKAKTLSKA
jgi:RNA-directed DNA polymerase